MDWNSTLKAWLLLVGFVAVLVSSQRYPRESRHFIPHPLPAALAFLNGVPVSSEENGKGPSFWEALGRERSTSPKLTFRIQSPRVLSSMRSESDQLSPTVPLVWPSSSDYTAPLTSPGSSGSVISELVPSRSVELAVTKTTTKPMTTSNAVASVSGSMEQLLMSESPRVISSPSSLDPRLSADGLIPNETLRTERYENSTSFLHGLDFRPKVNISITPDEPITSELNTSGLTTQPVGISPTLTIIPASSAETKGPTPVQASITVSPLMEGPGMVGHSPALSSGTTEANTSLYLTQAPNDPGSAIPIATLKSSASTPASITLASSELSVLVTLHPKETEVLTPEPSVQPEFEPPPTGGPLPSLIQNTDPLSNATVYSVSSSSRGPSILSSLLTLPPPSPTLYSPSPLPPPPPSSSLLPSPSMLVLSTIQSTTSGIPRDPSVPTSISASIDSSTHTSSLQFFHQTTHQEGLELTTSEPTRFPPSGSTPATASLTLGTNTFGLAVISDATGVMDSSLNSLVSLKNFSSISSASSSSTTPSIHLTVTPTITPHLSWSYPSMTESMNSAQSSTSVRTELSMPSASSVQYPSLLDSVPPSSDYNYVTRPLTFKITNEIFTDALYDPTSLEYRILRENVQKQLTPIYERCFSSFDRVEVNSFRPDSVVVNTSLVFGNNTRAPSPMDIVWVLYWEAKRLRMMLGNLSLAENSIQCEASTLTTVAPLIVHVSFTTMEPFVPSLLKPESATYTTLKGLTMEQVTPVVLGFYGMHSQEQPLLLFSNDDQWVGVTIVYKFSVPVPAGLRGLANRLAREVTNARIQKSSISVNDEKAELTRYSLWLRILNWPFTEALKNKTSRESQKLRERLACGLTAILKATQNFAEVIVEEFLLGPVKARVRPTYFSAAPSEADVQEWVSQGLRTLEGTEGLHVELIGPRFDLPSSRPTVVLNPHFPTYTVIMIVLVIFFLLVISLILILAFKTTICSHIAGLRLQKPGYATRCIPVSSNTDAPPGRETPETA